MVFLMFFNNDKIWRKENTIRVESLEGRGKMKSERRKFPEWLTELMSTNYSMFEVSFVD